MTLWPYYGADVGCSCGTAKCMACQMRDGHKPTYTFTPYAAPTRLSDEDVERIAEAVAKKLRGAP